MARMTLQQLEDTVEFSHLTTKQANFVRAYVRGFIEHKTFNTMAAVKAAYTCRSDESARTHGCHLLSNPKIVTVIQRFFGSTAKQVFDSAITVAIKNPKLTVTQLNALKFFAKVHGLVADKESEPDAAADAEPAPQTPVSDSRIPKDALKVWLGADGTVVGYRSALGEDIKL